VALVAMLIGKGGGAIPLSRLELLDRLTRADEVLSQVPIDAWRRIKAEQAVVAELEPEAGFRSLPKLLAKKADRRRLRALLDEVVVATELTAPQQAMLVRIRGLLNGKPTPPATVTADDGNHEPAAVP
jgi:hypothetical protein